MSSSIIENSVPAGLARSLDALAAFGALLACADEKRWASIARPQAGAMSVIVRRLHEDLALEVDALVSERSEAA